jgi:ceramide glucosyltransferase
MWIFYFFALIQLWLGFESLRGGIRFRRYFMTEARRPKKNYMPFASVIAPCKGLDQGLKENLEPLFNQDYPNYELLFVVEGDADPAVTVIQSLMEANPGNSARIVIAGPARNNGQKVHNLLSALGMRDDMAEVLVFVDSDARPHRKWLADLVEPLSDETVGAATGYRWFVPAEGIASHLRSVWNASITSALGANRRKNFCWGGSTAVRVETFEMAGVSSHWQHSVSDDYSMMRAMQEAGREVHFVPTCLIPSHEDCSFSELFEFTNRQIKITRVYAPGFWKAVFVGSAMFVPVFFGGSLLSLNRVNNLKEFLPVFLPVALIFLMGGVKSWIRFKAVMHELSLKHDPGFSSILAHILLWPVATALYLYNCIVAGFSRQILWRGIRYELKSPSETVIISNPYLQEPRPLRRKV